MKKIIGLLSCLSVIVLSLAQITNNSNTIGLLYTEPDKVSEGFTLFSPVQSSNAYLIDNCGYIARKWTFGSGGYSTYLLPDGSVARITSTNHCIELRSWEDELQWQYCSDETNGYNFHSDLQYLPNGNFLVLSFHFLSAQEAIIAGVRQDFINNNNYLESIIELKPIGINEAEAVWQWRMYDHIVQNYDSTRLNYGRIKENLRKINVNLNSYHHFNSLEYNAALDQISFSYWNGNEIYIIDHSTTTEEAAGSTGGNYGFGGDLLFRWGCPKNYDSEGQQQLYGQHNPQWIPANYSKFGGQLSVFNNRYNKLTNEINTDASGAFILDIDPDKDGIYPLNESGTFLPNEADYVWTGKFKNGNIYSELMSGINVMPNGNLAICEAQSGRFTEVDTSGSIVWAYQNPVVNTITIATQGERIYPDVFKTEKYSYDYIPQLNKDLCGTNIIENENELSAMCRVPQTISMAFGSTVNGVTVTFFSQSRNSDAFLWDFGDGNTSVEINPIHNYTLSGTYNVCLTGQNCLGEDTFCKEIIIENITSFAEGADHKLELYPIPATTHLNIKTKNHSTFYSHGIYNLTGEFISNTKLVKSKINIKHLQKGVYWLKLENQSGSEIKFYKFIKS